MLGLQYTQPGGIRALTGKWKLKGPNQKEEASETIEGSGGKALTEAREGNTFTYGNSEHSISSVDDDNTITLTSAWGGPSGANAEVYVSGLKPDAVVSQGGMPDGSAGCAAGATGAAPGAAGVISCSAKPFYKSPYFIAFAVLAGLGITYFVIRRSRRGKKGRS